MFALGKSVAAESDDFIRNVAQAATEATNKTTVNSKVNLVFISLLP